MKLFAKILKYQLRDMFRSKWIILYALFFLIGGELLFRFSGDSSKTALGLLNITLIFLPIINIVFGTIYIYNLKEYFELVLAQPIKRQGLYTGIYFGLTLPMTLCYVAGIGIPFLFHSIVDYSIYFSLLASGFFLTFIFIGIAIIIALKFDDKTIGIGVVFLIWLMFAVIYDGIIMLVVWQFSDYPLDMPVLIASLVNPIDLARIMVILKFDTAALMGYTGATFEKFFGGTLGTSISLFTLIVWSIIPFFIGMNIFSKKDF